MSDIKIPAEYLAFDYGFSTEEDPNVRTETTDHSLPTEVEGKIDEIMETLREGMEYLVSINTKLVAIEESKPGAATESELREKIRLLEAIIVPLLNNLLKTAEKAYIYWPDRKPIIEKQLAKVLEITRG